MTGRAKATDLHSVLSVDKKLVVICQTSKIICGQETFSATVARPELCLSVCLPVCLSVCQEPSLLRIAPTLTGREGGTEEERGQKNIIFFAPSSFSALVPPSPVARTGCALQRCAV